MNNFDLCLNFDHKKQSMNIIYIGLITSIIIHVGLLSIEHQQVVTPTTPKILPISIQLVKPTLEKIMTESQKTEIQPRLEPKQYSSQTVKQTIHKTNHKINDNFKNQEVPILTKNTPSETVVHSESSHEKTKIITENTVSKKEIIESKAESQSETKNQNQEKIASPKKSEFIKASYLHHPKPNYPIESKQNNEQGKVILKVLVNEHGKVEEVVLKQSSGFDRLDQSAISTVHRWTFKPAQKDNIATKSWVIIPIPFQLNHEVEED